MAKTKQNDNSILIVSFFMKIFLLLFLILPANINSVVILLMMLLCFINKKNMVIKIESVSLALAIYILLNVISVVYAKNTGLALKESLTWIMFFLVLTIFKKNDLQERKMYSYFVIGCMLANIIFLINLLAPISIDINIPTYNCLAMINCMLIIYIENLIQLGIEKKAMLYRVIQGVLFLGIIAASVRGIFALLVAYYVYYVIYKQNRIRRINRTRRIVNVIGILLLSVGVLYFLNNYWADYTDQMRNIFSGDVRSNRLRLLLYEQALDYSVNNNLFFGAGAGNFIEVYRQFGVPGFISDHAHNIFLQPFVELGLFGLMLTIAIFASIAKKLLSLSIEFKFMYLEIILPFLLYGMVDYTWVDLRVGITFFIFIGQLIYARNCKQPKEAIAI